MITAPVKKGSFSWAICEVSWYAVMEEDGNFELHDWKGVVLLQSNTDGTPGSFLQLQDDGHLGINGISQAWMAANEDDEDEEEEDDETGGNEVIDLAGEALARKMDEAFDDDLLVHQQW